MGSGIMVAAATSVHYPVSRPLAGNLILFRPHLALHERRWAACGRRWPGREAMWQMSSSSKVGSSRSVSFGDQRLLADTTSLAAAGSVDRKAASR